MKVDIWKSASRGNRLLSVPAGIAVWDIVDRTKLPADRHDVRLFRRGVDLAIPSPLAPNPDALRRQIDERGYALHVAHGLA